jgi:hypothetical protein
MFPYGNVLKTIFSNTFLEVNLQKPCSILRQEYLEKLLLLLNYKSNMQFQWLPKVQKPCSILRQEYLEKLLLLLNYKSNTQFQWLPKVLFSVDTPLIFNETTSVTYVLVYSLDYFCI